jgi:hypothetical protein
MCGSQWEVEPYREEYSGLQNENEFVFEYYDMKTICLPK